jgi:hypothetical protein
MLSSTHGLLDHLKLLRRAARASGAELLFAGETLQALVRKGDAHLVLHPQFLMSQGGAIRRTPALHDESELFLGWLPYRSKHWPLAIDRVAFQRHAAESGLPVARIAQGTNGSAGPVVVRRATPSFEPFLRGPYRTAAEAAPETAAGELCEPYVEGDALTVWYWDGRPVAAELAQVPFVVGDGQATLGDLVVRGAERGGAASAGELRARLHEAEAIARLDDLTLGSVLPSGARQVVGLGHGSPLGALRARQLVDLAAAPGWLPAMRRAGEALLAAIPEETRPSTLFTVQATLDARGEPWLVDLDASPPIHPIAYPAMLEALLPRDEAARAPLPQ